MSLKNLVIVKWVFFYVGTKEKAKKSRKHINKNVRLKHLYITKIVTNRMML